MFKNVFQKKPASKSTIP